MLSLSPLEIEAVRLSLKVSLWAVGVSLPLGIAVAWLLARRAFPLMVRAIRLSIEAIDTRLEQAARTLGAGPLDVFFSVTLPLTGSGIVVGVILAFARALGEFGATITFVSAIPGETTTLPIALYGLAQVPGQEGSAIRLVVLSVVIAFAAMFLSEIVARRVRRRIAGA